MIESIGAVFEQVVVRTKQANNVSNRLFHFEMSTREYQYSSISDVVMVRVRVGSGLTSRLELGLVLGSTSVYGL